MNRPSATKVRRTALDVSDQVTPHLSAAKETVKDDVLPKLKNDVLPKMKEGVQAGLEATEPTRKKLKKRSAAAGAAAAAHVAQAREEHKKDTKAAAKAKAKADKKKKSHKLRKLAFLAIVGGAAYAAYNAWKMPHDSEDWVHADTASGPRAGEDAFPTGVGAAASTMGDKTAH